MNDQSPTSTGNTAFRDLLLDIGSWRAESKERNLKFYADALVKNEITVTLGKEHTTRNSICDICIRPQKPGIRNFYYRETSGCKFFHFHLCECCWLELMEATPMIALIESQHKYIENVTN